CDEGQTIQLADELRSEGIEKGVNSPLEAASDLYQAYLNRFVGQAQARSKEEVTYKLASCRRRLGDGKAFDAAMQALIEHDRDDKWGKLAAFWKIETKDFASRMDDLMHLEDCDREQYQAFLEMSNEYLFDTPAKDEDRLPGNDDRLKYLYYRAR